MNTLKNAKGFTLIELIIIIIILGIISAVAVPKYLDMKTDAQKATAAGVLGALMSADSILFAKNKVGGTAISYDLTSVVSNASITGATVTAAAAAGTIVVGGGNWTFTYTAANETGPGQYGKGGSNW